MSKRTRSQEPVDVESRLETLGDAWEEEDWEQVLAGAEALLAQVPKLPEALGYRAAALGELGREQEAAEAWGQALKVAPEELGLLLGAADWLLGRMEEDPDAGDQALELLARGKKRARKEEDEEALFDVLLMEGEALNRVGECEQALKSLEEALELAPDAVEARMERAVSLFELCRFEEAKAAFEEVLAEESEVAWAHHHLGLIAERRGDEAGARQHLARARELDPEEFAVPVELGEEEFDKALAAAVAGLPEVAKRYMENVTLSVEPWPKEEDLKGEQPPLSPCCLGLFKGTPVGERSVTSAADHFPVSIVLYQRNLERFARTREELVEQIRITVLHEVGHLLGLDEDDLWERGLD
jgi:predicted Zn-dependent protease with MMP-like domain/Flp pilus assembly protein TadD